MRTLYTEVNWGMTINIDSFEVVIHTEDNWNMTINIDSIEVVIDTEDNWNMTINISIQSRSLFILKIVGI